MARSTMNKDLLKAPGEFDTLPALSAQGRQLSERYLRHFSNCGYKTQPPVSIASEIDQSVLFIGSTISVFKNEFLSGNLQGTGTVVTQTCLRTQNGDSLYNLNEFPEYCSHFHMIGGIAPIQNLSQVIEDNLSFFIEAGFHKEDLVIRTSSKDEDLIKSSEGLHPSELIELDTKEDMYYRWKYGMEGVSGRGLTFAVKDKERGVLRDIGNIIVMEKDDGTSAIQWGYGIETLISRLNSLEHPIQATVISTIIDVHSNINRKVADALVSGLEMYNAGVTPGRRKRGSRLTTYIRGLNFLRKSNNMNLNQLSEILTEYQEINNADKCMASQLHNEVASHEKKVQGFTAHSIQLLQKMSKDDLLCIVMDPMENIPLSNTFAVHQKEMIHIISSLPL
jgi:hypothetical protein